jgi:GDP-L-fucose synthase
MYGPRDHFEQHKSHVGAALLRKAYIAHHKSLSTFEVWGDGSATRDFVYVGDVAASIVKLVEYGHKLNGATLNFGSGVETKIGEFAELLCKLLESKVKPDYQTERPIGYQRRVLSCSRAREILGHNPQLELEDGLKNTLQWIKDTRQVDNWLKE